MTKIDTSIDWADQKAAGVDFYGDEVLQERIATALREAFTKGASSRDADIAAAEKSAYLKGWKDARNEAE